MSTTTDTTTDETVETTRVVSPTAESALPTVARMPERIPGERPTSGIPFGRLLRVEARKMFDTKAGRWLLILIGVVIAAALTIMFFVENGNHSYDNYLQATTMPIALILPVVGILAVTSEYSQRTALVTYGLEPRRARVTWAKLLVALAVGVTAMALSLALAAVAHQAAITFRGADVAWALEGLTVVGATGFVLLGLAQGVAFGMLLRNSPAAIVLYYLLPQVWSILGALVPALETPAKWLDMQRTMSPLFEGSLTGEQWAQLGTSVGVWVVLPLIIGMVMLNRAEVK